MELNEVEFSVDTWWLEDSLNEDLRRNAKFKFSKNINVSWRLSVVDSNVGIGSLFIRWHTTYGGFFKYITITEFDLIYDNFEDEEKEIMDALLISCGHTQMRCNQDFPIKHENFQFPLLRQADFQTLQKKLSLFLHQQLK